MCSQADSELVITFRCDTRRTVCRCAHLQVSRASRAYRPSATVLAACRCGTYTHTHRHQQSRRCQYTTPFVLQCMFCSMPYVRCWQEPNITLKNLLNYFREYLIRHLHVTVPFGMEASMLVVVVQSVTCFDCGDSPLLQCVNSANGYYALSNVPVVIHKLYLPLLQRYR